ALSLAPEVRLGAKWQRILTERASSQLAGIPSTRDPGFERVPGLVRQIPNWQRKRPRSVVRSALSAGSSAVRIPGRERVKLAMAAALGERIGADSYDWQFGKANWVRRMRQQEELLTAGLERYAGFVQSSIAVPTSGAAELVRAQL